MKLRVIASAIILLTANSALAADNGGPWTGAQLKKLCYHRAAKDPQNAKRFDICMKRNERKIGKQKQPGELAELNAADVRLDKKAATAKETK